MRRTWKDRRKQLQSGMSMPTPRLFTMVLMMTIMGMMIVRFRDPKSWGSVSPDSDDHPVVGDNEPVLGKTPANPLSTAVTASSEPKPISTAEKVAAATNTVAAPQAGELTVTNTAAVAPADLTPTGATDLDPMEQEDIKQVISVITDGNLEMTELDMPAYFQILGWVDHQSMALLQKRAKKDVVYDYFRKSPETMRLQLVELNLNVRQILRLDKPPKNGITEPITTPGGKPIYEVRGFTQEGGSNMYFGVVADLPKGMPIGTSIDLDVKLVGYFFKLQGYISQQQQLEAEQTRRKPTPLKAPVIIGRMIWAPSPVLAEEKTPVWILTTIAAVAALAIVGWVVLTMRKPRSRALPGTDSANRGGIDFDVEGPTVDTWLDQAQSGRLTLEPVPDLTLRGDGAALDDGFGGRFSGNIFGDNGESSNGHDPNNGHSLDNGHSFDGGQSADGEK